MKRDVLFLITAILICIASACTQGGETVPFTWNLEDSTLTISSGTSAKLDDYMFFLLDYRESINTIIIEAGVTGIGNFPNCRNLISIDVEDGNSAYVSVNGVLFNKSKMTLICYPAGKTADSYVIPNSVTTIGEEAFWGCWNLTSITIPNSVRTIRKWAFVDCRNLTSITVPSGVTTIGDYVFGWCENLTSINLPNSVTTIGESAFLLCSSLTSITIPNSVTTIEEKAFELCENLTSINLSNNVTTIGKNAFIDCSSLTSITIPSSVTTIGDGAFVGCSSLTSIDVENENSAYASVNGVLFDKDKTTLIRYPSGKIADTYVIPNSVTTIGEGAFGGCNLTTITIPNGVTMIEREAFRYCSNLTSITIPSSVTTIGFFAFAECENLTSINIPSGVTTIGYGVFAGCNLTSITIPSSATTIKTGAFSSCSSLTSIDVENENNTYASENGVLFNKNKTTLIYCPIGKTGTYVIPSSVTTIEKSAFSGCANLTSITIPSSVTTIESFAFNGYTNLTSITNLNPVPVPIKGSYVFDNVNQSACTLQVPKNAVSAYKKADVWKEFNIVGIEN